MIAQLIASFNYVVHKADISPASTAEGGLYIPHTVGIVFYGKAGKNLTLYGRSLVAPDFLPKARIEDITLWPTLGDNVIVGAYALVIGNVTVGDESVVAPQCVATKSVPERTILVSTGKVRLHHVMAGDR